MKHLFFFLMFSFVFISCGEDVEPVDERAMIMDYMIENGINATETASGLFVEIIESGQVEKPTLDSQVEVHYTGRYLDGTKFDSSFDLGVAAKFPLNAVILGWQEGIQLFGRDGHGWLILPSNLGYSDDPPSGIRNNAILVFEIFLIDFQ